MTILDSTTLDSFEELISQVEVNSGVISDDDDDDGAKVVKVVNDVPDWLTIPDPVTIEPSDFVVVQVEINSVSITVYDGTANEVTGSKIVKVVNEVPD